MPHPQPEEIVRAGAEVRGTQSFVHVMASVWRRPALVGIELLWRWAIGIPWLWVLSTFGQRIWLTATGGTANAAVVHLDHFNLTDPILAAERVAYAAGQLIPPALYTALWLVPVLLTAWVFVSTFGRALVMRKIDPTLRTEYVTQLALGAIRMAFLAAAVSLWLWIITWCGRIAVSGPASRGADPNLVAYFAMIITATLLLFMAWAATSWILSVAPLLAALRHLGPAASLRAALRIGPLRGKLMEINLVMGIVKIALVVLAMVFSATPLPFQTFTTEGFLWFWWSGVTLLYLIASDYFHVVRTAASLALCRAYDIP